MKASSYRYLLLAMAAALPVADSFAAAFPRGGGRASSTPDKLDHLDDTPYLIRPNDESECRLIILQITDVYTLENFASFKTLLEEVRAKATGAKVICMLTGDFLSPYLLSSMDRGNGMMKALNSIPLDYLTWGNHEADIDHRTVCRHVRNFQGTWLNSNMLDHEAMDHQQETSILDLCSQDGSQDRKVGLCAVLSDDPALYEQFSAPGAFGGATITDPWQALKKYNQELKSQGCDLVVPLQHLYVPDDHKTCRDFEFPVILSGHDHHKVDEVVDGSRLLKPGMNADYSTVVEISWRDETVESPDISARFVNVKDYAPDADLAEINERAYDVLIPMRNTELARIPKSFEPLSSNRSRESVTTMGKFICTLIKSSMNVTRRQRRYLIDAVLLMGGNLRGNMDYEPDSFFSLEALEAEIKADEVVAVVPMPGWLLKQGVEITHAGDPISGWMQYDAGIKETPQQGVTHVGNEPIDLDRIYQVATKISDLTNGQSPPWTEYYTKHPELLPPKGAYVNIHAELMPYCARNLWRKLWTAVSLDLGSESCGIDECVEGRLEALDSSGDGTITVQDIQIALRDRLGFSVDSRESTLAEFVHDFADTTGDGRVTRADLEVFCEEMGDEDEIDSWRLAFAVDPPPEEEKLIEEAFAPEYEMLEEQAAATN